MKQNHEMHLPSAVLRFFSISKVETIVFAVAAFWTVLLSRLPILFNQAGVSVRPENLGEITNYWEDFDYKYDITGIWNEANSFVVFIIIGCLIYILIWAAVVFYVDSYNDVIVSTRFLHPNSFHQSDYWLSIAARFILRATGIVLLVATLFWGLMSGFRSFLELSNYALDNFSEMSGVLDALLAVGGLFFYFYVVAILLRVIFLRGRVF